MIARFFVWSALPMWLFATAAAAQGRPSKMVANFDADTVDQPPKGFEFGRTGHGAPGRWVIKAEKDAPSSPNVLAQVDADTTDYRFPIAYAGFALKDGRASVKCKTVSGKVDQGCGLVIRLRDDNNYYVVRANALEGNVRLYRVVRGEREQLAGWDGKVGGGVWHELAIDADGDHFSVSFDGDNIIDAHDKTFAGPGKVGVWTKADSVIYFDNLTATPKVTP